MSSDPRDGDGNGAGQTPDGGRHDFLVVGLGASAGGVHAFKQFFERVPADSGMAYVVVLHLSPDHDSRLAEVLQFSASIPVTQVTRTVRLEPDHVYVIPPNQSLSMEDGSLHLSEVTGVEEQRAPVDIFFRTLAETNHARAVCVVLSGTGADGSMGLKRVKERGGLAVVQDPKEAEFADMPRNSIATGLVDFMLPAGEMPAKIISYAERLRSLLPEEAADPRADTEEQTFGQILAQLRARTGHDFVNYKRATIRRRIERRLGVTQMPDLQSYAAYIRERPEEGISLLKDLLISVTNFFRDPEAFAALERDVIPKLFEGKGPGGYVRAWVAGCATGEEAYSLAMLLAEYTERMPQPPPVQVFATDIDEAAISTAREGFYTINDTADVPPERLRHFFHKMRNGYRVRRELREMVLFANHNLLRDPPFSHLDLVTCRNMLIYFNAAGQEKAMEVFHFALRPGGYLLLGGSESAAESGALFATVDKAQRIYQSRAATRRHTPQVVTALPPVRRPQLSAVEPTLQEARAQARLSYLDLHQRLLELYAPPSVLVNSEHDVVHISERAGRFMEVRGGEPSNNLLVLVRPELRVDLRTALFQASQSRANVEVPGVTVRIGERTETVRLHVRPVLGDDDTARGFCLVIFEAVRQDGEGAPAAIRTTEPAVRQLEDELTHVKAQLRSTVEQYEVQHEELRASNEELQAMNEELRSTAEELETSKEELQSVNEELTTVNQELKIKIEELSQSNNDLQNLMNSTEIGTLFLDRALRVKLFTPRTTSIFNLIPADIGRPLSDITSKIAFGDFRGHAEEVLDNLRTVEREVMTLDGLWYLMRLFPYRTSDDRISGVVITFLDITGRKRAEEALVESQESLAAALEMAEIGVWRLDAATARTHLDETARRLFGQPPGEAEVAFEEFMAVVHPEDREGLSALIERTRRDGPPFEAEHRVVRPGEAEPLWVYSRGGPLRGPAIKSFGFVGATLEIHERRSALDELRLAEERLRLVIESVRDYAIFSISPAGLIEYWNSGAQNVFGYREEEILGQSVALVFTPEDRELGVHEHEMRTALAEGRASDERWHLRKDGSRFFASGVMRPVLRDGELRGFVKVARDLTERRRAEEQLQDAHSELEARVGVRTEELSRTVETMLAEVKDRVAAEARARGLVGPLVTAQEDERRRISRDLHDQLGQQLTALRLKLEALKELCGANAELCRHIEELQSLAAQVDSEVDFLAWELRPTSLDDLGLAPALANFVEEWSKHYRIRAEFHAAGMDGERLSQEAETCLYRIAQESLNNVNKYSQAAHVAVILERRNGTAVLIVEDDGVGFDPNEEMAGGRGLGLVGMRERAALLGGELVIETAPGEGTTIIARIPVAPPDANKGGGGDE